MDRAINIGVNAILYLFIAILIVANLFFEIGQLGKKVGRTKVTRILIDLGMGLLLATTGIVASAIVIGLMERLPW